VQSGPPVNVGYEPFPFDEAAWRNSVEVMTQRWKNTILGWEWLNEIVPGSQSQNPVADYLEVLADWNHNREEDCPASADSDGRGIMAAQLRADLLKAGIGQYVDVLPYTLWRYGQRAGRSRRPGRLGLSKVSVWDNETSSGISGVGHASA
jgi:hypothetical protein